MCSLYLPHPHEVSRKHLGVFGSKSVISKAQRENGDSECLTMWSCLKKCPAQAKQSFHRELMDIPPLFLFYYFLRIQIALESP